MRSYRIKYIEDCGVCHGTGLECVAWDENGPVYSKRKCKHCTGTGRTGGETDLVSAMSEILRDQEEARIKCSPRWR